MNSEQIRRALRFVAMGHPNHPDVMALAEFLAKPEHVEINIPMAEAVKAQDNPRRGRKPKAE